MPGLSGLSGMSGLGAIIAGGGTSFITPGGDPITDNEGNPIIPGNIDDLVINDVEFSSLPGAPATPATGIGRLFSMNGQLYFIADTGEIYGPFGGSAVVGEGRLTGNYLAVPQSGLNDWYDLPGMTTTFQAQHSGLYSVDWRVTYRQIWYGYWWNFVVGLWVDGVNVTWEQNNASKSVADHLRYQFNGHRVINLTAGEHTVALRYYRTAQSEYTNGLITVSR